MQVEAPQVEADLCDIARRLASIPRAHNAIWQELLKLKGRTPLLRLRAKAKLKVFQGANPSGLLSLCCRWLGAKYCKL